MDIIALLIPIALFLGLVGLVAFFWSMRSGQFDDLDGAALRALRNDDGTMPGETAKSPPPSPDKPPGGQ